MSYLFSRVRRVNKNVTVEARELPDGGLVLSGTRYHPTTKETEYKPTVFSKEASYSLYLILNSWVEQLGETQVNTIKAGLRNSN